VEMSPVNVTRLPRRGRPRAPNRNPLGIRSVETALDIFQCIIESEGGISLSALSRLTGVQPSKLHRYLVSLVKYGYIYQSDVTGLYDLGVSVRRVGIAAFNRFDEMKAIGDILRQFALEHDCTMCHYIWTEMGPTLINIEFGNYRTPLTLRIGSSVPLCGSATGRLFLAYLPKSMTAGVLADEKAMAKAAGLKLPSDRELDAEMRKIRSSLIYATNQTIAANVTFAAVAPILDRDRHLFSAIIALPPIRPANVNANRALISKLETLVKKLSKNIFGHNIKTVGHPASAVMSV
jgi:DNA-binding IclR family transcriptional regulator